MFETFSDADVVEAIGESARAENSACARRLAAIAELYERRVIPVEDGQGREMWRVDPWEAVAAEISAAQCITAAAAGALMHQAICLRERRPRVGELFAAGAIDYRTVRLIVSRTLLALAPDVLAAIDAELAAKIPGWGPLSVLKTQHAVDAIVVRHDPEARRRSERTARGRHVDIVHDRDIAYLSGQLNSGDATMLDRQLTALAHSVCDDDPRTVEQRRADAMGALAAGDTRLACACGRADCTAEREDSPASIIVHVVAEAAAVDSVVPQEVHGERPGDDTVEVITSRERLVEIVGQTREPVPPSRLDTLSGVVMGGSAIPAAVLADLIARGVAELRPVVHPGESPPEPRYKPSQALAEFVRCRDLTCRFPGCDCPADLCDLDHTVPFSIGGPTHASNLKAMCRKHHLIKTFWGGPGGWRDEQLPDGTVVWHSPSGRVYRTTPGSALLVPALCEPTGALEPVIPHRVSPHRGVMMPRRKRTRVANRHRRIMSERALNVRR
ncbi:MAG: DUF222 domain-containing protein [Mycobacterium sp.]